MKRRKFMLSALAIYPLTILANIQNIIRKRTDIGFKVNSGEARFGRHYKMKGVTLNVLDIKISGSGTDGDLSVFEQNGLSPNGVLLYIFILFKMNGFMLLRANIYFR